MHHETAPKPIRQEASREVVKRCVEGMKIEGQRKGGDDQTYGSRQRRRGPIEEYLRQRQAVDERKRRVKGKRAAAAARDLHEAKTPPASLGDVFFQAFGS